MNFEGIFVGDGKNEHYNRMHHHVDSAKSLNEELGARMRAKFRELRRVNREWDRLLDELAQTVTDECKKRLAGE